MLLRARSLGSSPLTRGKPLTAGLFRLPIRLIPAHAGKTAALASIGTRHGAHPRSRGENCGRCVPLGPTGGSSPLTRGKPQGPVMMVALIGLIPAHAGKTPEQPPTRPVPTAHPRSRGENSRINGPVPCCRGSSPLTRGKPPHPLAHQNDRGLIPAHAGKTASLHCLAHAIAAHPRSRGENPHFPTGIS